MSSPFPPLHLSFPSPFPTPTPSTPLLLSLPQNPDHTSNPSPEPKPTTLRSRLSQLCKEGRLAAARRLFDALPRPAPTLIWNTLLIGYASNSLPADALRFYSLMNSSAAAGGGPPRSDHYTYSSALKACADARQLALGRSIHCHLLRRSPAPPKNRVLNNSLLNMYASALAPEWARADAVRLLFDGMPKRNVVSWNTLIGWYVRSRRPAEALAQFKSMIEVGVRPTPVSFINVLPAAVSVGGGRCADMLYGFLVRHGSEYASDQFVLSSAIFMYSELLDVQSARKIFDQAEFKNIEVWNTMIGGYVQNDRFDEAVTLFIEILESDVVDADTVTFLSSLVAVSQLQDVRLGQQVHAFLVKEYSMALPLILCNALIVMYSRCGCVQIAFELFCQMPERDLVSWNTMVSAFVQNHLNFEGLLLVYEMQREGFSVDSVTVMALLSAASNLGSLRIGKETHGYLIRHGIQCEGLESYLIDMYAKSGSVRTASQLFDGVLVDERDQVTWNAMIAGYTQSGRTEEAISVFRKMLEENQVPNSVTLSSVLPACNPVGRIQAGKQIHGFAIRRYLDSNVFVGTALVDMYSKSGEILSAERVFDGMKAKNTVTYTTMLSGYGQHGLGKRALSLFQSMKESGKRPDAVTFVAVISACSYSGLVEEGLSVYESMEEFGIVATPEHYCCIVDLLGRAGRVEAAYEFIQRLGDEGNLVGIWGSLLAACKVNGKFELGKLVSEKLFEIGKENGLAGYHVLLSNVYAAEEHWDNVDRVRKEMRERGLRKEPGSSWIDVGDTTHRFISRDQKHPEYDQIYRMLQELALEMKLPSHETPDPCLVDGKSEVD
ncbi:pentatricopeptide repeat-containing protein At3g22150, chloroplastic-like [Phoenix dactylifera]|uniref:Pentatricopeptide repeat-containing protein At3g22150, chloroplastic-like n=1 Tax=Phoenix dactylifera TaxID=42345 RepID=A0A8B8ZZS2_PHODC|nr:pentatricopeptide repeat-containing protein At3g22150, chloroplastic-like [Phoenix dactylifera]